MALPNTIILGAQKAGTTSLFNWISQHPDVYGEPGMKDFPFFVTDEYFNKGLDWFSDRFKKHKNEKIILHGFVNYIYFHKEFIEKIKTYNKNTKYIIVLRNPIKRAYSAYWFNRKIGVENTSTFEEAIKKEQNNCFESIKEKGYFTYLNHGFYYQQIKFLTKHIDSKKILIILFKDLIENNSSTITKIYKYLGISTNFKPNFNKINEAGIIKNILPLEKRIELKHWLREFNIKKTTYPSMNKDTKKKLESLYANDINKLEELLKIDLSIWKAK